MTRRQFSVGFFMLAACFAPLPLMLGIVEFNAPLIWFIGVGVITNPFIVIMAAPFVCFIIGSLLSLTVLTDHLISKCPGEDTRQWLRWVALATVFSTSFLPVIPYRPGLNTWTALLEYVRNDSTGEPAPH